MSSVVSLVLPGLISALLTAAPQAESPDPVDRIYGTVETAAGEVYEGFIRWDRNEGSWSDLLHGSKELPFRNLRQAHELLGEDVHHEDHSVEILGLRISWSGDDGGYPDRTSMAVRFGHLRSLETLDDDRARLHLKSGGEVELKGGSTDIGDGIRGIEVVDPERGSVELRWRDLDRIDFLAAPAGRAPPDAGRRLHGTLRTRSGDEFTGAVAWDVDEILTTDVLDGEERGRDREIPFAEIRAIERDGPGGARVILRSGEEVRLRGSNDVNDRNRGIAVADPGLGQVTVEWDEFESLVLSEGAAGPGYEAFDGGRRLHGTVEDEDGRSWTGLVRWDNDEEYGWEMLDGHVRGAELAVELGLVDSIRKGSSGSAEVFLRDGRTFELRGSNDVNRGNKGVFVTTDDGDAVALRWEDFQEVRFHRE